MVCKETEMKHALPENFQAYGKVLSESIIAIMNKSPCHDEAYFSKFEFMLLFTCQKNTRLYDFFYALFQYQDRDISYDIIRSNVFEALHKGCSSLPELVDHIPLHYFRRLTNVIVSKKY